MSEENKATIIIFAPKDYDVKKYSLAVHNNFNKDASMVSYGISEIEFEFDQTDEDGNLVAIVEYPTKELLKNPRITLFNGTIEESKNYKVSMLKDNKHLAFAYPDKDDESDNHDELDNNDNKSQIFKIELCKSHEATLQKTLDDNELCYEYWTEEQLNEYKEKLSKNESNIVQQDQIEQTELDIQEEEENKTDQKENDKNDNVKENNENDNTTENDKIQLSVTSYFENANAFLLDGKFYLLNDEIYLDKNKECKIEPVYYNAEKQRFYYFPESHIHKFNTDDINNNSITVSIYDSNATSNISSVNITSKPINRENQANTELSFGAIFTAGTIICSIFLGIGMLAPIIAWPLIAGCTILAAILLGKGGYDDSKIYTPPKENKSQEPETKNSDELNPTFNQGIDDPIWAQTSTEPNPLFNGSNDDDEIMHTGFEESWGENVI